MPCVSEHNFNGKLLNGFVLKQFDDLYISSYVQILNNCSNLKAFHSNLNIVLNCGEKKKSPINLNDKLLIQNFLL